MGGAPRSLPLEPAQTTYFRERSTRDNETHRLSKRTAVDGPIIGHNFRAELVHQLLEAARPWLVALVTKLVRVDDRHPAVAQHPRNSALARGDPPYNPEDRRAAAEGQTTSSETHA